METIIRRVGKIHFKDGYFDLGMALFRRGKMYVVDSESLRIEADFAAKPKTLAHYENRINRLLAFERLAGKRLDAISSDRIAEYVAKRQEARGKPGRTLQVASLNRELQVLRRMFHLAQSWRRVERALLSVKMIPGENHRRRALTPAEEALYFRGGQLSGIPRTSRIWGECSYPLQDLR